MTDKKYPSSTYYDVSQNYPEIMASVEHLGKCFRGAGPLDEKTSHLVQLAAAAAMQSEGSVHSHTKRAVKAGATPEEIYHTLLLLIPTSGFPRTMAAISWCRDILEGESGE